VFRYKIGIDDPPGWSIDSRATAEVKSAINYATERSVLQEVSLLINCEEKYFSIKILLFQTDVWRHGVTEQSFDRAIAVAQTYEEKTSQSHIFYYLAL
jgi:hypothetical protein